MATIELSFTPNPAHVRTARQVAVSLARRVRFPESRLDAVRLAVGEACSLVVALQRKRDPREPVVVQFDDSNGLSVDVRGAVPLQDGDGGRAVDILAAAVDSEADELPVDATFAVVSELVPRLDVSTSSAGVTVSMRWPAEASAQV